LPDSKVNITASGVTFIYQWYAWSTVLSMIKLSYWWKDPLDLSTYYTYATNLSQTKFELLWFLEDWSNSALSLSPDFAKSGLKAVDASPSTYSWRFVITKWDQLWILLSPTTKLPIQETWTGVDILKTSTPYIAQYTTATSETWTGQILVKAISTSQTFKTCKQMLDIYWSWMSSWYYKLNPTNNKVIDAYCDMTFDWGGWTRIVYQPFALMSVTPKINYSSWAFYSQYGEFSNFASLFKEVELKTELWKFSKCNLDVSIIPSWRDMFVCSWNTVNVSWTLYTQDLWTVCFPNASTCKPSAYSWNITVAVWNPIHASGLYGLALWDNSPTILSPESYWITANRWCATPDSPEVITWMAGWDQHWCHSDENLKYWWKKSVSMLSGTWVVDTELHLMLR
jgi:hypothetical protein